MFTIVSGVENREKFFFSSYTVFSNFSSRYIFTFKGDTHNKLGYQDTIIMNI